MHLLRACSRSPVAEVGGGGGACSLPARPGRALKALSVMRPSTNTLNTCMEDAWVHGGKQRLISVLSLNTGKDRGSQTLGRT